MPSSIVIAIVPSISSVVAAFLLFGLRNAGTPLLIASTPVRAAQPEENARASRKAMAAPLSPLAAPSDRLAGRTARSRPSAGRPSK